MCFVRVGDLTKRIKKKKSTPLSNIQCNKIVNFILSNTSFGKRFEMVNKYAHPSSFGQRMLQIKKLNYLLQSQRNKNR